VSLSIGIYGTMLFLYPLDPLDRGSTPSHV